MPLTALHLPLALICAPLLPGVINRVKAFFAGREGQSALQPYRDLFKLLRKGAVYSRTTTWVFRAGPVVSLSSVLAALALLPLGGLPALLAFPGDIIAFAYVLALGRFFTVTAALDTGSAFEGMGASREVWFSALSEPALLLGLAAMAKHMGKLSLTELYAGMGPSFLFNPGGAALLLAAAAFMVVYLAENSRVPFDDPNTHLELTMIHEVMVLDHGGPDFGLIQYAAALKLWAFGALVVGIMLPVRAGGPWLDALVGLCGMLLLALATGVVESIMARLRLIRVSQLLAAATALSVLALMLVRRSP
ncbi:MAG TPA: hydrogenase [Elusimicrobia bacterium]|nr:hydrogenase [Elusimicrobiota bacterium]HBT60173.1 hydrogenase [Elusimicrobiota bacterium]